MKVERNKSIRNLNTMRIEAFFDYYALPDSIDELKEVVKFAKEKKLKIFFLGNGSNILFSKDFYQDSILIDLKGLNKVKLTEDFLYLECGVTGAKLMNFCIKKGFSGFEFLAGIPGTVGGFVRMNAGSFNQAISDILEKVKFLNLKRMDIFEINKDNLTIKYRNMEVPDNCIIIGGYFKYRVGDRVRIINEIKEKLKIRKLKQPRGYSAGSIFKNGNNYFAGKLIEDAGLKGKRVGDAVISNKHANFIINMGNARGRDVLTLIEIAEETVKNKFGVKLEREVIVV